MWKIPAILTVCSSCVCGMAAERPVFSPMTGLPGITDFEIPAAVDLTDAEVRLRVRSVDPGNGKSSEGAGSGPWRGFEVAGVRTEGRLVSWSLIAAPDRLRLGREILRRGDRLRDPAAWSLLAVALMLSGDDSVADRAMRTAVEVAGDEGERVKGSILALVEAKRQEAAARAAEERALRLADGRPHLLFDEPGLVLSVPPDRLPTLLRAQRSEVEQAVDGLGLTVVPTRWTLAVGVGPLETVALRGVRLDDLMAKCRELLGCPVADRPFAGSLVLIEPGGLDEARLLVAGRFGMDWVEGESSMLIPTPDGPWAVMPESKSPRSSPPGEMVDPEARRFERATEEARLAARATILWSHGGRALPIWLVEGFAEASAGFLVDLERVEGGLRPRAVESIRQGRHPSWVVEVPAGDPGWGPTGEARGMALILVTRLLESPKPVFSGLVRDLKSGRTLDQSFQRWLGMPFGRWLDDSADWFRFND